MSFHVLLSLFSYLFSFYTLIIINSEKDCIILPYFFKDYLRKGENYKKKGKMIIIKTSGMPPSSIVLRFFWFVRAWQTVSSTISEGEQRSQNKHITSISITICISQVVRSSGWLRLIKIFLIVPQGWSWYGWWEISSAYCSPQDLLRCCDCDALISKSMVYPFVKFYNNIQCTYEIAKICRISFNSDIIKFNASSIPSRFQFIRHMIVYNGKSGATTVQPNSISNHLAIRVEDDPHPNPSCTTWKLYHTHWNAVTHIQSL